MQKVAEFTEITPTAPIVATVHGGRAKCLQRLIRLDLPVPRTVAIPFDSVRAIAQGHLPDLEGILEIFGPRPIVSVRSSAETPDWGGPGAILNIGMNDAVTAELAETIGTEAAEALYLRFIRAYALNVARLGDDFLQEAAGGVAAALQAYEAEMEEPFPQDPRLQLAEVLRSMARAWEGTTARLLRQARGAPADAGLGFVIQEMALGIGPAESGSGVIQFVSSETGEPAIIGRYLSQSQGRDALDVPGGALYLTRDPRGPSLEDLAPDAFRKLLEFGATARRGLREEMQIEFTIAAGKPHVIDAVRVPRSSRAGVAIVVRLVRDGIIPREEAILRTEPASLAELLHPQVEKDAPKKVIARGIAASPGAATGRLVFTAAAAQAAAAQGDKAILVRRETGPEDIRGMHAAQGVITERGGMTSHAAVIARGLGLPCVAGAGLRIDFKRRRVIADGHVLSEGDIVTVDGTHGEVLEGAVETRNPALDEAFQELMGWATEFADMKVRANADTPADARVAKNFGADGIGLCRTEHMFFQGDRLTVMREMIFTDEPADRRAALERLLPMQRDDFVELFHIMQGLPVCIRLFDPPLHEFLPHTRDGMRELAEALGKGINDVERRVEELQEFNPMLGLRGVRVGITVPEIYDMQVRAILEAAIISRRNGVPVVPEIMIPLVSAEREVELIRRRVEAVAAEVRADERCDVEFRLGVMVETPRAALRADDIADQSAFLSFGTNDLTQMTYGLSRDDAGRFMSAYVQQGVFREDPFHTLDIEGVGELLSIAASRARNRNAEIVLSVCGEHGGDPDSIAFCRRLGFDYVSCSPYRVPIARLAAARQTLADRLAESGRT
ncbi:MAG: pyruvate, phosphate dikinase [Alphaproteobacteria bacterium]|nr:MAG: pyruvate, phosphate dikinase [Alphaproteobacteria bacterium]